MSRHLGLISLVGGVLSWCALLLALLAGGVDPSPANAAILRTVSTAALLIAVAGVWLGVMALARGPQRLAAAFGLGASLLFLLYFTGLGFAIVG